MKVEQLMTRNPKTCQLRDTANHAAQLMWECDLGCVPIIDDKQHVVGIVTDRDIAMASYLRGQSLKAIPLESMMSHKVFTCTSDEDVGAVVDRMQKKQIRRIPVLDAKGSLVGMVSMNDLALEAARGKGSKKPDVALQDVALTLAGICRHRGSEALAAQ